MRKAFVGDDLSGSLSAFGQYMREVRQIADLSREEEARLLECLARGEQEQSTPCPQKPVLREAQKARARLIEGYQSLVLGLARRYAKSFPHLEYADLVAEGNLGLIEAVDCAAGRSGGELFTYACLCIRGRLVALVYSFGTGCALDWRAVKTVKGLAQGAAVLRQQLGREPGAHELAAHFSVSLEQVCQWQQWRRLQGTASLQALQQECYEEGEEGELELVGVFDGDGGTERVELSVRIEQVMQQVLSPVQREVLRRRYGLGEWGGQVCSQEKVARELGVSRPSVGITEARGLARLREVLELSHDGEGFSCVLKSGYGQGYYSATEAAARLGIGRRALQGCVERGELSAQWRKAYLGGMERAFEREAVEALVGKVRKSG